jgi:5-methylcytosine-specific restriction endonuclease McrA
MSWEGSTRKQRLPSEWQTIRRRILDRDGYRCTVIKRDGTRCWEPATDVHHLAAAADTDHNLVSMCAWHHQRAIAAEGNVARTRLSD